MKIMARIIMTMASTRFTCHRDIFILLILATHFFGVLLATSSQQASLQEDTSVDRSANEGRMTSFPYKPYGHKNIWQRCYRNARAVNSNVNDVKSCGSCCLEDPVSPENSLFINTEYQSTLSLNNFYGKVLNVNGVPVAASSAVSDAAVLETALTLIKLASKHPFLLDILREEGVHFAVIGKDEIITDNPHYRGLNPDDWDYARGVGATRWAPTSSCAEENLLCLANDPYYDENICVHEHAHTLEGSAGKLDTRRIINGKDIDDILKGLYISDVYDGNLWENTYAGTNHEEMWAEAVQSYYSVNRKGKVGGDGLHNHVWSRELLQEYHPELYELIEDVFPLDVEFSCPTTSLDDCDCTRIRKLCTQAGVTPKRMAPTPVPTKLPTPSEIPSDSNSIQNASSATNKRIPLFLTFFGLSLNNFFLLG